MEKQGGLHISGSSFSQDRCECSVCVCGNVYAVQGGTLGECHIRGGFGQNLKKCVTCGECWGRKEKERVGEVR